MVGVDWTQRLGGLSNDTLMVIRACPDGGCIVGGTTKSGIGGNKTSAKYGGTDLWVARRNSAGEAQWDKTFGGARNPVFPSVEAYDYLDTIVPATDGGFLLVGESNDSVGGSKTVSGNGYWDMYVIKINAQGDQIWDRALGSSAIDAASGACATSDGGYALVGFTQRAGNSDVWVVKLDSFGNLIWERSYGGTNEDQGVAIIQRTNGGYFVAANSASQPSGTKTSAFYGGGYWFSEAAGDFWILSLDSQGNKIAEQSFGGIYDEAIHEMIRTDDDGVIVVGQSLSPASGNKNAVSLGNGDGWIVRLDAVGNKIWERSLGGPWWDKVATVQLMYDGGFIVGGATNGVTPWLVRLDHAGTILWQQNASLPSDAYEVASIDLTPEGGFFIGGSANLSANGFGQSDFAITRTKPEPPLLASTCDPATVPTQGFVLQVRSVPATCVVEWSPNVIEWFPLQTNISTGTVYEVIDGAATNVCQRFYRVLRLN